MRSKIMRLVVGYLLSWVSLAVALSLANDPALILADEPTGNLDTGNTETITWLFLSLAEKYGKTVIMASHDPKAVEHFKTVYNMRDGSFV